MTEIRNLYVYPAVTESILSALKIAKQEMAVDYLIKPQDAVQGVLGRILAVGGKPPWLVWDGFAPLGNVENVESVKAALEWCMGKEDARATDLLKQLKDIFGEGIREIDARQQALEGLSYQLKLNAGSTPTFR